MRDSRYGRSTAATDELQADTDEGAPEGARRILGRSSKEYREKYSSNSRSVGRLVEGYI